MPPLSVDTLLELAGHVGEEFGPTEWHVVVQDSIEAFAAATGDCNWYHLDRERAARELPGGRTIAHGLLTLSLVPFLTGKLLEVRRHGRALNYGFDRVRFAAAVPEGARIRMRMRVLSAESSSRGMLLKRLYTIELEGSGKPAMVAEMLTMIPDDSNA